jgi:hypothetical protein
MKRLLTSGIVIAGLGIWSIAMAAVGWYWLYGPYGMLKVSASRKQLHAEATRWSDAVQVARATPMIALAGPLGKMQEIHRETEALPVAQCAEHARNLLAKSMGLTIDSFLALAVALPEQREAAKTVAAQGAESANSKLQL